MSVAARLRRLAAGTCLAAVCGCSTTRLEVTSEFPVPLMAKTPVALGVHLDEELTTFTYTEKIDKRGEWEVSLGTAQARLFENLATGTFQDFSFVDAIGPVDGLDGTLVPHIEEVQFAIPGQTRSKYYEVWIRYQFELYDRVGDRIGEWSLPAYGKASSKDYGSSGTGLQAAALAACRDAMAFFSINFAREPVVRNWLAAGKPLVNPA